MMISFAKPAARNHFAHPLTAAFLEIDDDVKPCAARSQRPAFMTAHAELVEEDTRYLLELQMPGLGPENVQLELHGRQLTVVGSDEKPQNEAVADVDMADGGDKPRSDPPKSSEDGRPVESPKKQSSASDGETADGHRQQQRQAPRSCVGGVKKRRRYKRTVNVPRDVKEESLNASMDKGILQVVMPKRLPEKRKIAVTSGRA